MTTEYKKTVEPFKAELRGVNVKIEAYGRNAIFTITNKAGNEISKYIITVHAVSTGNDWLWLGTEQEKEQLQYLLKRSKQ
jgi:hypothetical protein